MYLNFVKSGEKIEKDRENHRTQIHLILTIQSGTKVNMGFTQRKQGKFFHKSWYPPPTPVPAGAQLTAICEGLIYNCALPSTALAKAGTKSRNYHNYFGLRLNPFTEHTFLLCTGVLLALYIWLKLRLHIFINTEIPHKTIPSGMGC